MKAPVPKLLLASNDASPETVAYLSLKLSMDLSAARDTLDGLVRAGAPEAELKAAKLDVVRVQIALDALSQRYSTVWSYAAAKDAFGAETNKCNLFVYDTLKQTNTAPPLANGNRLYNTLGIGSPKYPVLAGQWADPAYTVSGWKVVTDPPRSGDVIATSDLQETWTGHVGIFVGYRDSWGWTSSAASSEVVVRDWPFRKSGARFTVRRYFGK